MTYISGLLVYNSCEKLNDDIGQSGLLHLVVDGKKLYVFSQNKYSPYLSVLK